MKPKSVQKFKPPHFDIAAVRAAAGDKVFARGEPYFRGGDVDIFAFERDRALAQVRGTDNYRVQLAWHGKRIDGTCSCPAFGNDGFCKHMVAVALAVLATGSEDDDAAAAVGAGDRIREYLKAKGVDALVDMIVGIAENDPALYRRLDGAAAVATLGRGDDKAIEAQLRKLVDGATRTGDFVDYAEAEGWAAAVDDALGVIADLPPERAGIALKLAERAIDRIEKAIERVDDSDGHCSDLLYRAGNIHLAAALASRPEPVAFARHLFTRELSSQYDVFVGAARDYADALGETGLAEYRRLATERWEELPRRTAMSRGSPDRDDKYRLLMNVLDFFAERDGDVATRVALRAKDLSSTWQYLELAKFCLAQERVEDALRVAQEGLRVYDDAWRDERLVTLVSELLVKLGRESDADAHLRDAFVRQPGIGLYEHWRKISGTAARDDAIAFLQSRLVRQDRKGDLMPRSDPADLLIRILMRERRFADAWDVVGRCGAALELKYELATKTEKTHPARVLAVYAARVDALVGAGNNRAYDEAAKLVAGMAKLRTAAEQVAYVAALKARFGRKRNFMMLLG